MTYVSREWEEIWNLENLSSLQWNKIATLCQLLSFSVGQSSSGWPASIFEISELKDKLWRGLMSRQSYTSEVGGFLVTCR